MGFHYVFSCEIISAVILMLSLQCVSKHFELIKSVNKTIRQPLLLSKDLRKKTELQKSTCKNFIPAINGASDLPLSKVTFFLVNYYGMIV